MSESQSPKIKIVVSGICPLLLVKDQQTGLINKAAFALIDDKRHVTSLKINDAELGAWMTGKVSLTVNKANPNITTRENGKNDSYEHIVDLEKHPFFEDTDDIKPPLLKVFDRVKSQFHFNHGEIFTNRLHDRHLEFYQEKLDGKKLGPRPVATEIGVLIELDNDEEAVLDFEDQKIKLTLKGSEFDIVLDNLCSGNSARCPDADGDNDFLLNYKILAIPPDERFKARRPIGPRSPAPRICSSLVLSKTVILPDPDDYLKDTFDS